MPAQDEREQLWNWFGVPSFVLVLDAHGRLAAYECEAENEFHVKHALDNVTAGQNLCACGRPGPRIPAPATDYALTPMRSPAAARAFPFGWKP